MSLICRKRKEGKKGGRKGGKGGGRKRGWEERSCICKLIFSTRFFLITLNRVRKMGLWVLHGNGAHWNFSYYETKTYGDRNEGDGIWEVKPSSSYDEQRSLPALFCTCNMSKTFCTKHLRSTGCSLLQHRQFILHERDKLWEANKKAI